jgi:hypothetical protein
MQTTVYHTGCHRRKWPYLLYLRLLLAWWTSRGENLKSKALASIAQRKKLLGTGEPAHSFCL